MVDAGQEILFVYRRGTQPGTYRRALPTGVEDQKLFAKTIGEEIEKPFVLEDIVLVTEEDVQRDQIMPYKIGKTKKMKYLSLDHFLEVEKLQLERLGWQIIVNGDKLELFSKSGESLEPALSLEYVPYVEYEPLVLRIRVHKVGEEESAPPIEKMRAATNEPWVVSGERYKTLDGAAKAFLRQAVVWSGQ